MSKKLVIIALLFFVFFLIGCDTYIVSPLIPNITSEFNIASGYGGYLVTVYSMFYVIFSPILGPMSDKIGRKKMIIIGMIFFSLASFFTALSKNYIMILVARSFTGVGAAFAAPNVWSYVGDCFEYKKRGKITGIIASGLSVGMILGVPIGSFLAQEISWRQNFYILGIISIIVGVLMIKMLPNISIIEKTSNKISYIGNLKLVFKEKRILTSFIVTFLISFGNFGLYTFLGYWLSKQFKLNTAYIGFFLIVGGLGNFFGAQISGILSDKYGKKKIACIFSLVLAITLMLVPLLKFSLYLTGLDVFLWLCAGGASFTVMQIIATQLSLQSRGTVMAINNSFFWGGTAFGSAIVSCILNSFNFFASSAICALSALLSSIILYFFAKNIELDSESCDVNH